MNNLKQKNKGCSSCKHSSEELTDLLFDTGFRTLCKNSDNIVSRYHYITGTQEEVRNPFICWWWNHKGTCQRFEEK